MVAVHLAFNLMYDPLVFRRLSSILSSPTDKDLHEQKQFRPILLEHTFPPQSSLRRKGSYRILQPHRRLHFLLDDNDCVETLLLVYF